MSLSPFKSLNKHKLLRSLSGAYVKLDQKTVLDDFIIAIIADLLK